MTMTTAVITERRRTIINTGYRNSIFVVNGHSSSSSSKNERRKGWYRRGSRRLRFFSFFVVGGVGLLSVSKTFNDDTSPWYYVSLFLSTVSVVVTMKTCCVTAYSLQHQELEHDDSEQEEEEEEREDDTLVVGYNNNSYDNYNKKHDNDDEEATSQDNDEKRPSRSHQDQTRVASTSALRHDVRRLAYACTDDDDCQHRRRRIINDKNNKNKRNNKNENRDNSIGQLSAGGLSSSVVDIDIDDSSEVGGMSTSSSVSSSSTSSSSSSSISKEDIASSSSSDDHSISDDDPGTFEGVTLQVFTPIVVDDDDDDDDEDHDSDHHEDEKEGDDHHITPFASATTVGTKAAATSPLESSSTSTSTSSSSSSFSTTGLLTTATTDYVWDRSYVLGDPVQLDLGIVPKHYLDFAYSPVVHTSSVTSSMMDMDDDNDDEPNDRGGKLGSLDVNDGDRDGHENENWSDENSERIDLDVPRFSSKTAEETHSDDKDNQDDESTCKVLVASTPDTSRPQNDPLLFSLSSASEWWTWWFPNFARNWWKTHGSSSQDFHTDKNAFAGGSHGQVWKGRRVCRSHDPEETQNAAFLPRHHRDRATQLMDKDCDGTKQLVLKRLRVGQGHRLLEAGLREVYFGNVIDEVLEPWQQERFTVYVDHFYREVPRAFGRVKTKDLELWIVFEDAGPSLRSYIYTATTSGSFVIYQHSKLWTQLRMSTNAKSRNSVRHSTQIRMSDDTAISQQDGNISSSDTLDEKEGGPDQSSQLLDVGRQVMRSILHQIISAASILHEQGIVHRDIKPSNVMCFCDQSLHDLSNLTRSPHIHCRLGDFSSGWDDYTRRNLYTKGPSPAEQSDEYAPPESYLGPDWVPFHEKFPHSYDSWSIGVLALELLLGTPNVFSIDQRTNALITNRMKRSGATDDEIAHALYYAALSQYCIRPNAGNWPLREGDPLNNAEMTKRSCTLQDFHKALRARDPLGIGFDSSSDLLLHLIWQLLAFHPSERMTAKAALDHPYFTSPSGTGEVLFATVENAIESQMLDPRLDFKVDNEVQKFTCPKCGRTFEDWHSCLKHANVRRHARFCTYDTTNLPTCINTHSMLPSHPKSGYCDLQGRRPTIEDFHSIHLYHDHQFYAVMDGHTTNFASKWVASKLHNELMNRLTVLTSNETTVLETFPSELKDEMKRNISAAFLDLHERFLEDVDVMTATVVDTDSAPRMDQSGTTATALVVTDGLVIVASLGDSRAVMSSATELDQSGSVDWSINTGLPGVKAIQLTKDHVASDPVERDLVIERGGSVFSRNGSSGLPRVNGTLAITRSIGDADLSQFLSREPHVLILDREELQANCGKLGRRPINTTMTNEKKIADDWSMPCFAVLASDGLWDMMSNEEAVEMVSEVLLSHFRSFSDRHVENTVKNKTSEDGATLMTGDDADGDDAEEIKSDISRSMLSEDSNDHGVGIYQKAAERLAVEAYVRGSTDNIGVCVVELL